MGGASGQDFILYNSRIRRILYLHRRLVGGGASCVVVVIRHHSASRIAHRSTLALKDYTLSTVRRKVQVGLGLAWIFVAE